MFRRLQYRYKTAEQVLAIRRPGLLTERSYSSVRQGNAPGSHELELDLIALVADNASGARVHLKAEP